MLSVKKKENKKWENWSKLVLSHPEAIYYPKHLHELVMLVKTCQSENKKLRVVGAGHSFTPLVATSEILVSLDYLSGIESLDRENHLVTVWAGTRLKDLGKLLANQGYAMENLGDINAQSIAGAISTGTHGTGTQFGSLSTQVTKMTVLTAKGELIEVSHTENNAYFAAMKLSLGMLGIIVKVQLRVLPKYLLVSESFRMSLKDCFNKLSELKYHNRNFEFFWFPHTETVQIKLMNTIHTAARPKGVGNRMNKLLLENGVFWMLSEMCRIQPSLSQAVSTVSAKAVPIGKEVGESFLLYATPRLVKFNEMEYSLPAEDMEAVLTDIKQVMHKQRVNVHFPLECRYVKRDDLWLSPSYERDSAYIAVHMYKGMAFKTFFDAIEEVFFYYEGRPHWGKMHSMTSEKLAKAYPRFTDFLHVRETLDPDGMLVNEYLRKLFGI